MAQINPVRFLRQAAKNSPWLVIAVALHAVIVAVMSVIYLAADREAPIAQFGNVSIHTPAPALIKPPDVPERRAPPENLAAEIVDTLEPEYTPTDAAPDLTQEVGDPNSETSGEPSGGMAIAAGIGSGFAGSHPSPFAGRGPKPGTPPGRPGRETQKTQTAVLEGLRWLMRHQQPDGSWSATALPGCCVTETRCVPSTERVPEFWQQGLTGLSLLAFLGAGYNFDSKQFIVDPVQARPIYVGEVVRNGLKWLKRQQQSDGSFGPDQHVYNQALCALALAEAYGQSKNFAWKEPAQRAIDWLVRAQKSDPDGTGGRSGWRYHSAADVQALVGALEARMALVDAKTAALELRKTDLDARRGELEAGKEELKPEEFDRALRALREQLDEVAREIEALKPEGLEVTAGLRRVTPELYDADLSVTTWVVMALKSAEASGLKVPREAMQGGKRFALSTSTDDGRAGYLSRGGAGRSVGGKGDHFEYHVGTMGALAMLCRTFVDRDIDDPFLERAAQQLIKDLPEASKDKLSIDYYYWYYGSLALNQFDGPDSPRNGGRYWGQWNRAMQEALLSTQDAGERVCARGGWVTPDRWSLEGGPIYATAINVLTLEVYYRYENAFR